MDESSKDANNYAATDAAEVPRIDKNWVNGPLQEFKSSSNHDRRLGSETMFPVFRAPLPFDPITHYELLIWLTFIIVTTISIVDRFFWNIWPRQMFNIGAGSAGSDHLIGLKAGPWSVKTYDIFSRISGRYSIFCLNLLFYTMMRSTSARLAETWLARRVVDFSNHEDANRRIHIYNGIALVAVTLLHVWTVFLPCLVSGWSAKVVAGVFEWPLSERKPNGFIGIDVVTRTMSLQVDDVFRLVLMTTMLAIVLPITVHWMKTRWHIGILLHSLLAILYFIDIVRRHTHPHSWILNTPFFLAWLLDHAVGIYWRRRSPIIFRQKLSEDYMVLFWKQDKTSKTVAPKYYLRDRESSRVERAHVFTATENWIGADLAEGREWTTCLVVRIYHSVRTVRLPKQDKYSHTERLATANDLNLHSWGPFHGSMSERIRSALEVGRQDVVLAGGGSAAGYLLDGLQYQLVSSETNLTVLYTARDCAVFKWMVKAICSMKNRASFENVRIILAVTNGKQEDDSGVLEKAVAVARKELADKFGENTGRDCKMGNTNGTVEVQTGRIDFAKQIRTGSLVFFEGSGGLQKAVRIACGTAHAELVAGPAFDDDSRKRPRRLRMNFFVPPKVNV